MKEKSAGVAGTNRLMELVEQGKIDVRDAVAISEQMQKSILKGVSAAAAAQPEGPQRSWTQNFINGFIQTAGNLSVGGLAGLISEKPFRDVDVFDYVDKSEKVDLFEGAEKGAKEGGAKSGGY
tara:strand:+ start:6061 stop:6429 length:369 start_codon:yes stop_codon:yes gene_type:complete